LFVHDHPESFTPEAGAWGRDGCTAVQLASVDEDTLGEALTLAAPPVAHPGSAEQWIERSRALLDCIVAGIRQIDEDTRAPRQDKKQAGSVDLF